MNAWAYHNIGNDDDDDDDDDDDKTFFAPTAEGQFDRPRCIQMY